METVDITKATAQFVGDLIGVDFKKVNLDEFARGIVVELEHGSQDPETNVTDNDLSMTGRIAWAHLKELPDYYTRLDEMEATAEEHKED